MSESLMSYNARLSPSSRFQKLLAELLDEFESALATQKDGSPNHSTRPAEEAAFGMSTMSTPKSQFTFNGAKCPEQTQCVQQPAQGTDSPCKAPSYATLKLFPEWRDQGSALRSHRQRAAQLITRASRSNSLDHIKEGMNESSSEKETLTGNTVFNGSPKHTHEPQRSCVNQFVCTPLQQTRLMWDMFGTLALAWDLFQVPSAVFDPPESSFAWLLLGWFSTCYWTLDILANCFVGYFDRISNLVMDFRSIIRRYARTWFLFDLLLVISDWMRVLLSSTDNASQSSRMFRVLRVVRTLRLLRLLRHSKLKELVLSLQEVIDSPFLAPVLAMVSNAILIIIAAHFIASAWFGVGLLDDQSWIVATGLKRETFGLRYLESYRMALTFCFGRNVWIQPENTGEVVFMIVMKLVGLMVFSTFIGGVTSRLTKIRDLVEQESLQMFHLKQYLKDNKTSPILRARVIGYAEYARVQHKRCRRREDVVLLGFISGPLHIELETEVNRPYLIINPFFKQYDSLSAPAMSQVCFSCLTSPILAKDDTLFRSGLASHAMFIVKSGILACRHSTMTNTRETEVLRKGHWFCEPALWMPWIHKSRMKAIVETELIGVNSSKFRECSACHPKVLAYCCAHALQFLEELNLAPDECWDLPKELLHPDQYEDAEFHHAISNIKHVHPMGKRFANMIAQAEMMSARLVHDETPDEVEEEEEDDEVDKFLAEEEEFLVEM